MKLIFYDSFDDYLWKIEFCCSEMSYAVEMWHNISVFHDLTNRRNPKAIMHIRKGDMDIFHCPFCGEKIEYIEQKIPKHTV